MWSHPPWQCGVGRGHQSRIVITVRYLRRGTSLLTFQSVIDRIKRTVIVVGMQFRKAWGVWSGCWAVKIVGTSWTKHHVCFLRLQANPQKWTLVYSGKAKNLNCKLLLPWGWHFVVLLQQLLVRLVEIEDHNCKLWPYPWKIEFVVVQLARFWGARVDSNAEGWRLKWCKKIRRLASLELLFWPQVTVFENYKQSLILRILSLFFQIHVW